MADLDLGVLFNTDRMSGGELIDYAKRVEGAGVSSLWLAELFGREPFAAAGALLSATTSLRVGTAIANVYARDAVAAAAASTTLAELGDERFTLGLGVSNRSLIERRGHRWQPPASYLADYLAAVRAAPISAPDASYPVHVAAHGPKMMAVAAEHADGVFTYLMTPEHTARTRGAIGDELALTPMMMALLCTDADEARRLARSAVGYYTGLDYYHRAWRTLGFDNTDLADGGSDRLVDSLVAWGSIDDVTARIAAHRHAGATGVVVIPLNPAGGGRPAWDLIEAMAR